MTKYLNGTTDRAALVGEIKRLRDAINVHRREHTGDAYCARDRKLYAALGINVNSAARQRSSKKSAEKAVAK